MYNVRDYEWYEYDSTRGKESSRARLCLYRLRTHLEYNNSVWASYRKLDIDKLEKVQKRATKMIQGMGNFKYPESRLRQLELPTLTYRKNREDMIVTWGRDGRVVSVTGLGSRGRVFESRCRKK